MIFALLWGIMDAEIFRIHFFLKPCSIAPE